VEEHARGYVGAILEIESYAEVKRLRLTIEAALKSLGK